MKDSGIDYLGLIPAAWKIAPLKSAFQISKRIAGKTGYDVLSITQRGLRVKDIESGEGQIASDYSNYQIVEPGDYAMNHMDLLTGWIDLSEQEGVTSPDYRVFQLTNDEYDKRYYLRFFQTCYSARIFYGFGKGISGMGRWRLPADQFRNMTIPVPPLFEQRAIAAYLDKACAEIDRAIEAAENSIEQYLNYRKSTIDVATTRGVSNFRGLTASDISWLEEMPKTWKVATVGAIATEAAAEPNEDAPYIGLENVESFTSRLVGEFSTVADMGNSVSFFDNDAVLLSKLRPYLAKACYPGFAGAASSEMLVLKTIPNVSQRWFVYLLLNYRLVDQLNADTAGVRMPRTSWKAVKRHLIPVPSIEEQIAIADYLDEQCARIDTAIAAKRSIIDELKAYKKSLVYEYVTGKREVPCQ